MIHAVIIDFDDTLCLTEKACFALENEVLRRMGRKPQDYAIFRATWGQMLSEAIKVRSPGVDVDKFEDIMSETQAEWVKAGRIDVITPENIQTLDTLIRVGKEVFVLTSRAHSELVHILEPDHELASRVRAFYYREIMTHHKPDPRAFSRLLEEHNLKPQECVYVGDSLSDAVAANGADIHFIACLEAGIRTKKDFDEYKVEKFIEKFDELPEFIVELDRS